MPRIRYQLAPLGLVLNYADPVQNPEGSLRQCRNIASLAGGGSIRTAPPLVTLSGTPIVGRSFSKFNGRFIQRGTNAAAEQIWFETAIGSGVYTNLTPTIPVNPSVTLRASTAPMLFTTAQPTSGKDEHLFMLDPPNLLGDNALLKLNNAGVVSHWGINAPAPADVSGIVPTLVAQQSKYINTVASDPLDSTNADGTPEWPLTSGDDNGLTVPPTHVERSAAPAVDGNSLKVVVAKNDSAVITRTFGGSIDLTTFGAQASSNADFISFFIRVRKPSHIENVEVTFSTGDTTFTNTFGRELTFQLVRGKRKHKLIGTGDLVKDKDIQKFIANQQKTDDLTFSEQTGVERLPVAKNTWTRVTLPKNTFDQGGTPLWSQVQGIRFTVTTNANGRTAVWLDSLKLVGGAGMYGDYAYTITYSTEDFVGSSPGSRSNPPIDDKKGTNTGIPNSIVQVHIANVERQAVLLTFPALVFDPQVKKIEIWRTVGNGALFFRAGEIAVTGGTLGAGTTFTDSAADYYGSNELAAQVVAGNNTSLAVLDGTVVLPTDNISPNYVDPLDSSQSLVFEDMVNKPHMGRMWWGKNVATLGTQGLVYYSPPGRLESVQGFVYVTSGVTDPIQKLIVWNDRLFAFTKAALYEIVGTDEPFVAQRIEGCPGTLQPYTVADTTIGLMWVGPDGVYLFNGQFAENITDKALMPLFRYTLNVEQLTMPLPANSRAVGGRNAYYLSGTANTFTLVYDFESGSWRYLDAVQVPGNNTGALYYDPSTGKVFCDSIAGGTDVTEIDPLVYPAVGTVAVSITYPSFRSGPGRQCILRKLYVDLTVGASGAGGTLITNVSQDGVSNPLTNQTPGIGRTIFEFNVNLNAEIFFINCSIGSARDVQFNSVEADIYVPGEVDPQ